MSNQGDDSCGLVKSPPDAVRLSRQVRTCIRNADFVGARELLWQELFDSEPKTAEKTMATLRAAEVRYRNMMEKLEAHEQCDGMDFDRADRLLSEAGSICPESAELYRHRLIWDRAKTAVAEAHAQAERGNFRTAERHLRSFEQGTRNFSAAEYHRKLRKWYVGYRNAVGTAHKAFAKGDMEKARTYCNEAQGLCSKAATAATIKARINANYQRKKEWESRVTKALTISGIGMTGGVALFLILAIVAFILIYVLPVLLALYAFVGVVRKL
jgi:hypothetical protein